MAKRRSGTSQSTRLTEILSHGQAACLRVVAESDQRHADNIESERREAKYLASCKAYFVLTPFGRRPEQGPASARQLADALNRLAKAVRAYPDAAARWQTIDHNDTWGNFSLARRDRPVSFGPPLPLTPDEKVADRASYDVAVALVEQLMDGTIAAGQLKAVIGDPAFKSVTEYVRILMEVLAGKMRHHPVCASGVGVGPDTEKETAASAYPMRAIAAEEVNRVTAEIAPTEPVTSRITLHVPIEYVLSDSDRSILLILNHAGRAMTYAEIARASTKKDIRPADAIPVSKSVIQERVPLLMKEGFIARPARANGTSERKGVAIINKGRMQISSEPLNQTPTA